MFGDFDLMLGVNNVKREGLGSVFIDCDSSWLCTKTKISHELTRNNTNYLNLFVKIRVYSWLNYINRGFSWSFWANPNFEA
jgi:hypothetical protein